MAKNSKRVRSEILLYPIANWNEADDHLKRIGDLQVEIVQAELDANLDIYGVKAKLKESTETLTADIKRHIESLEAFAANHIEDFGSAKSRKLQYGMLGWRASKAIKTCKDVVERIKSVFGKKAETYLRVKTEADKEALAKLTDEQLVAVGCRRESKDVFYAEPGDAEAVEY
jgi:phage host-nuclease inhibitor protein Gam